MDISRGWALLPPSISREEGDLAGLRGREELGPPSSAPSRLLSPPAPQRASRCQAARIHRSRLAGAYRGARIRKGWGKIK